MSASRNQMGPINDRLIAVNLRIVLPIRPLPCPLRGLRLLPNKETFGTLRRKRRGEQNQR